MATKAKNGQTQSKEWLSNRMKLAPNFVKSVANNRTVLRLNREGLTPLQIREKTGLSIDKIVSWLQIENYQRTEPTPTSHPAGSLERIQVFQERLERGEELFHEHDSKQIVTESTIGRNDFMRKARGLTPRPNRKRK